MAWIIVGVIGIVFLLKVLNTFWYSITGRNLWEI